MVAAAALVPLRLLRCCDATWPTDRFLSAAQFLRAVHVACLSLCVVQVKESFLKDVRKSCGEVWAVVAAFKADRAGLGRAIDAMKDTLLVDIEKNYVHDEGVFEDKQQKHRLQCRKALTSLHADMVATLGRVYSLFRSDSIPVQKAWLKYIRHLDKRVESALRNCVKSSLTEIQRAICGG